MFGEEVGPTITGLFRQRRRALDVCEEQRDGSGGKIAIGHPSILAPAKLFEAAEKGAPFGTPLPADP